MFGLLVKKQLMEIFKSYFYDSKKNTRRKTSSTIIWFAFYILLMAGVLGTAFTLLAVMLCEPLVSVGMGWLYFILTGMIAIALGTFGSVFSTYSGLYLSKDNDLLLSMPIPVGVIIASRLVSVYLIGLIYSAVVSLPAAIVYLVNNFSLRALIFSLLMIVVISIFVTLISCILGWVVAKISLKLKNKSIITVLISVVFLALYYFIYFKAQSWLSELISNVVLYGEKIKGKAYALYLFGRASEGDIPAFLAVFAAICILAVLIWLILSKSFINIATSNSNATKTKVGFKHAKQQSVGITLLKSEFSRFISNANYMLNCGLGTLMLIVASVALLIKGEFLAEILTAAFGNISVEVLFTAAICFVASMNDMAAPSISLEGKGLWIKQSLPITGWQVLKAKLSFHFLLTAIPSLLCLICSIIVLKVDLIGALLMFSFIIIYTLFNAAFSLFCGMRNPNFSWTSDLMPIKQSMAVMLAMFGSFIVSALFGFIYMKMSISSNAYLCISCVVIGILDFILIFYLKNKDSVKFSEL